MDEPQDPITALKELATQFHELFREYVSAGFTEAQAIELLKAQIVGINGGKA